MVRFNSHAALAQGSFDVVSRTEITSGNNDGRIRHSHGRRIVEGHWRAAPRARYGEIGIRCLAVRQMTMSVQS